jgi:DNA polymerase-3 subunit alpha
MQRILHAAHRGGKSIDVADAEWEYDILLTYPESDREIMRDMVATGLSKEAAKASILSTEDIASQCNVELPKAPPPSYVAGERDWEPWA